MRKQLPGLLLCLVFSYFVSAQSIVRFKASKPYAILGFLETASGSASQSSTLAAFIDQKIGKTDTIFSKLAHDFSQINLSYNYKRDELPANRHQYRSTYDLLIIAAVKSDNLASFRENSIGILPNSTHQELFRILAAAESYYDRVIWDPSLPSLDQQILGLKKYESTANELFRLFRTFYHSSWTNDIPFVVSIYPIPGRSGNTSATPHANSLCVGVLTDKSDPAGTMSVVIHEMCHVLYDEEVGSFQHQLDSAFMASSSPFKNIAYNFFDEALATALGNGWAYEKMTGKPDTTSWYNNEYINGFAHAIFPMVKQYLSQGKVIDPSFIEQAIRLFGEAYPRSLSDYSILLNNMYLYADRESGPGRQELRNALGKYFQTSRYNFSAPILHEYSIASLKTSRPAQLIVIDRDQATTLASLKEIFPEIEPALKGHNDKNYVLSFYDHSNRPVIIVTVNDTRAMEKAFRLLKEKKYMDKENPYFTVD